VGASGALANGNGSAVQAASDAFGTSVGRETIGLYSTSSVRGFSPTAAGNVRIDGLYFDQVWGLSARLRSASQVRVGLTAQGFVFPAPTGIVDHGLRRPGERGSGAVVVGGDHWGSRNLDWDVNQPLGAGLGVTGGVSLQHTEFANGTDAKAWNASLGLWWQPDARTEALLFFSRHDTAHDQIGPQLSTDGTRLPPFSAPREFQGPSWAAYSGVGLNRGALLRHALSPTLQLRGGLFHSEFDDRLGFSNLLVDVQPDGSARRLLFVDGPSRIASDSGELRLSWTIAAAPWAQRLHAQLAGRARERRTIGSQTLDYGAMRLDQRFEPALPVFSFSNPSLDQVKQRWLGLSYELRWTDRLEANAGLQHSDYRKRVARAGLPETEDEASPLLYNLSAAWHFSPTLAAYAGVTRGLEESGVAPGNASNRNQALPAVQTTQRDAGMRWQFAPQLKLVAGFFDVRKPYFNLDASNLFTALGDVQHRGFEFSLSGRATPELRLVAGAVFMRPRVRGEAVALGRVGERPVGQPERVLKLNAVWQPAVLNGISLDAGLAHTGAMPATRNNRVELPALTELDLGLRWPLQIGAQPVTARLLLTNATNRRSFELRGAGSFAERPGRLLGLSLTAAW